METTTESTVAAAETESAFMQRVAQKLVEGGMEADVWSAGGGMVCIDVPQPNGLALTFGTGIEAFWGGDAKDAKTNEPTGWTCQSDTLRSDTRDVDAVAAFIKSEATAFQFGMEGTGMAQPMEPPSVTPCTHLCSCGECDVPATRDEYDDNRDNRSWDEINADRDANAEASEDFLMNRGHE